MIQNSTLLKACGLSMALVAGSNAMADQYDLTLEQSSRGSFASAAAAGQGQDERTDYYSVTNYATSGMNFSIYQPYFNFDLSSQTGTVTQAVLRVYHPEGGYNSPDDTETVNLYEVTTDAADLLTEDGYAAIHTDLGDGTVYGSFETSLSDEGSYEEITLNADALEAINAQMGNGTWSVGAGLTSADYTDGHIVEEVFSQSSPAQPATQLILTIEDPKASVLAQSSRGSFASAAAAGQGQDERTNYYGLMTYGFSGMNFTIYQSYFSFDLSSQSGTVASATLRIYQPEDGYQSPDDSETVNLYEVTTDAADLLTEDDYDAIHTDLGDGTVFGSFAVAGSDNGSYKEITLNADALEAINAQIGTGTWSVGTGLATVDHFENHIVEEVMSGASPNQPATQLILQFEEVVSNVWEASEEGFITYPNPSNGAFWVEAGEQSLTGSICDLYGKEVKRFAMEAGDKTQFELEKGVYILTAEGMPSRRIIIE